MPAWAFRPYSWPACAGASGQTAGGSGLGWSIVHRIAAVHGLAIAVDRSPTFGGLRVVVSGGAAR